jgi:hypothetical protein
MLWCRVLWLAAAINSAETSATPRADEAATAQERASHRGAAASAHAAARADLREIYWWEMAAFFELNGEAVEPAARHDPGSALPGPTVEAALGGSPGAARGLLSELAGRPWVDRGDEGWLRRLSRALARANSRQIEGLLRAPNPTLRAHVWIWLATTEAGQAASVAIEPALVDAAIGDRSVVVEHGEDLVFRPIGDYALAVRLLRDEGPEARSERLREIVASELPAVVRAAALGVLLRGAPDLAIDGYVKDPVAAIRLAAILAAQERPAATVKDLLDYAAADPDDRVTQAFVERALHGARRRSRRIAELLAERPEPRLRAALVRAGGELAEAPQPPAAAIEAVERAPEPPASPLTLDLGLL